MKGRKQFFFEKKNQKTFFAPLRAALERLRTKTNRKVFWFFFSKKNCFLPPVPARQSP